jgi:diketogulonate reductase-like aldo/keto reductase
MMNAKLTTSRRQFLFGITGIGFLNSIPVEVSARDNLPHRRIPRSDESLPVIGIGSTKAVRQIPDAGTAPIESVIRRFLSYGGRVIDTSPRPERIDEDFGRVLNDPDFRDVLFVAAKVKVPGRDEGIAQFRQTQRLFRRETVDLLQIESLVDLETHWPSLREFKESGEARYIGVTVSHEDKYETLESFMRRESPDFIQVNYSPAEYSAEDRLLPLAEDMGIGVLVNGPFMNGDYFDLIEGHELPGWAAEFDCRSWAQFSLKYILSNPTITCVLTETTNPDHMEDNIHAAFGRLPDQNQRQRMKRLIQSL